MQTIEYSDRDRIESETISPWSFSRRHAIHPQWKSFTRIKQKRSFHFMIDGDNTIHSAMELSYMYFYVERWSASTSGGGVVVLGFFLRKWPSWLAVTEVDDHLYIGAMLKKCCSGAMLGLIKYTYMFVWRLFGGTTELVRLN